MEGLEKIEYKKLCQRLGIPTAPFVVIEPPKDALDKDDALRQMAQQLVDRYHHSPELKGKAVFAKHNNGGGGRGSKKIQEMTFETALEAIRKIVNDTGGNLEGVYAELALDFQGALVYQIEIERDANGKVNGARLVWFNRENQKVAEIGFTNEGILEFLPKEIYDACRDASDKLFAATPYNNRGTNEMLIVKDKEGHWSIYALEFNKRVQVENEAIAELECDQFGRTINVPAEQVMRAMGYPAPESSERRPTGDNIIIHLRLLSCDVTPEGSRYHNGVVIDGGFYPQDADVQFVRGPVKLTADPQIGRALIRAKNWEEACDKLADFAAKFQFFGFNTEKSTYFDFIRKLAANPKFRAKELGCNQTIQVLADAPVDRGEMQQLVETLANTVTPIVTHGYRPGAGIKDQPYPTLNQMKEFVQYMEDLAYEATPETPFSQFLKHGDYLKYIQETKDMLDNHGGGTVSVMRDVFQSSYDQESALVQRAMTKIVETVLAATGIHFGNEQGGAQYQAFLMRNGDWMAALLAGCPSNMPAYSLTRSKWLNGLKAKPREYQAFVFKTIASEVCRHYGVSMNMTPFIPWMPYNFHAGNHKEQDITTREMLRAGFAVIPCWAWDPRYTKEDFSGWVKRQMDLFAEEDKPLLQIRIKNPGQGPQWNADVISHMVETIRHLFKSHGLPEPLIMIHNHEFNGLAAHIADEAIVRAQQAKYPFLIVDSAPPGTSHNSNLIVSKHLNMSSEERDKLKYANLGNQIVLKLARRFNNQEIINNYQDPFSLRAGGTNSSDIASMNEMKIDLKFMNDAIGLGRVISGLGTEVTPNSEFIKLLGMAIWLCDAIQPKTPEAVRDYINNGGQLMLSPDVLNALQEWKTLLPRPRVVEQLLINHGKPIHSHDADELLNKPLDIEAERAKLQRELPRTKVTDRELSTVIGFDDIGKRSLIHRDHGVDGPRDMTPLMDCPEFVHAQTKKVGDTFTIYGKKVTITKIEPNKESGTIEVDYNVLGRTIRTRGIDPHAKLQAITKKVQKVTDKSTQLGAPWTGCLNLLFAKKGTVIEKDMKLLQIEAMKQQYEIRATDSMIGKVIETIHEPGSVEVDEVVVTFKSP